MDIPATRSNIPAPLQSAGPQIQTLLNLLEQTSPAVPRFSEELEQAGNAGPDLLQTLEPTGLEVNDAAFKSFSQLALQAEATVASLTTIATSPEPVAAPSTQNPADLLTQALANPLDTLTVIPDTATPGLARDPTSSSLFQSLAGSAAGLTFQAPSQGPPKTGEDQNPLKVAEAYASTAMGPYANGQFLNLETRAPQGLAVTPTPEESGAGLIGPTYDPQAIARVREALVGNVFNLNV